MKISFTVLALTSCAIGWLSAIASIEFKFISMTIAACILIVAAVLLKKQIAICVIVFGTSYLLASTYAGNYQADRELIRSLYSQPVTINATVIDDPSYHKSSQREFHVSDIEMTEPLTRQIKGNLRIRSYQANGIGRGDKVLITGKIYRALGNRHGTIQYASIQLIEPESSWLEDARLNFFAATYSILPDPESSLGLGFLVGLRNLLPGELSDNLRSTGLTHIVAVSGYNLTILVFLTRRLLQSVSKLWATVAAISLILIFLSLTGGAPSIIRASIVSFLSLGAWYYGRSVNPLVLLLLSAAISAYISPYFVWSDIGWYLSFSAFFGVLVLAPLVEKKFFKNEPKVVGKLLIETTCAQLLTLPIIAFIFGEVSVVSILANLIVLPLIPFAMAATFLAGIASWFLPIIAPILAMPARLVLTFIVEISPLLASSPLSLVNFKIDALMMGFMYFCVFAFSYLLYRRLS